MLDSHERANRAALLLAKERYDTFFAPFVAKDSARLTYIKSDILRLVKECAEEVGAEEEYVRTRLDNYLEQVHAKPKHEELGYKSDSDSLPPEKFNAPSDEPVADDIVRDDVANHEPTVTEEEAAKGDAKSYDLKQDTQPVSAYSAKEAGDLKDVDTWKECFRCEVKLNPVYAQTSPVCAECTRQLLAYGNPAQAPDLAAPVQAVPFQCTICGFQGTQDEVRQHIQQDHPDVVQRQQQGQPAQTASKEAQDDAVDTQTPEAEREEIKVPPAGRQPADLFDSMVDELANRAAAQQFSIVSDDELQQISEQTGASPDDIKNHLVVQATFGDYTAVNGKINGQVPDGLEEIQFGGKVDAHEALVPTDMVVQAVASETNTQPDLVYNMVRDRYGADLSDKYHTSVSGDHRFFLPPEYNQQGDQQLEPEYDPEVGPSERPNAV